MGVVWFLDVYAPVSGAGGVRFCRLGQGKAQAMS